MESILPTSHLGELNGISKDDLLPTLEDVTLATDIKWKIGSQLTPEQREQVVTLLEENRDFFAFSLEDLGTSHNEPMTIPLKTTEPVFQGAHRLSPTEWEFVDQNCQKLLALGMIRSMP